MHILIQIPYLLLFIIRYLYVFFQINHFEINCPSFYVQWTCELRFTTVVLCQFFPAIFAIFSTTSNNSASVLLNHPNKSFFCWFIDQYNKCLRNFWCWGKIGATELIILCIITVQICLAFNWKYLGDSVSIRCS